MFTLPVSEYNRRIERFMTQYTPMMVQYKGGLMSAEQAGVMYDLLKWQYYNQPSQTHDAPAQDTSHKYHELRTVYDGFGNLNIEDSANGENLRFVRQPNGTYSVGGTEGLIGLYGGRGLLSTVLENAHAGKMWDL